MVNMRTRTHSLLFGSGSRSRPRSRFLLLLLFLLLSGAQDQVEMCIRYGFPHNYYDLLCIYHVYILKSENGQ